MDVVGKRSGVLCGARPAVVLLREGQGEFPACRSRSQMMLGGLDGGSVASSRPRDPVASLGSGKDVVGSPQCPSSEFPLTKLFPTCHALSYLFLIAAFADEETGVQWH